MCWGSGHGFPAKYGQYLRIINVKYRHEKNHNTLFTIFCCIVFPCEYIEAALLSHTESLASRTHTRVWLQLSRCRGGLGKGTVKPEPQEWQHWECSGLFNGQWAFLRCTNKMKTSPLPATLQSKRKKSRGSFSGEGASSIVCWCIGICCVF